MKKDKRDHRIPSEEILETLMEGKGAEIADSIQGIFESIAEIDPSGKLNPLAVTLFSGLMTGTATPALREFAGKGLARIIEEMPSSTIVDIFADIVKMKRAAELRAESGEAAHRNARALQAYNEYRRLFGQDPSKPVLKAFIHKNPAAYGTGWPGRKADPKGWTRIWEESGLSRLDDR